MEAQASAYLNEVKAIREKQRQYAHKIDKSYIPKILENLKNYDKTKDYTDRTSKEYRDSLIRPGAREEGRCITKSEMEILKKEHGIKFITLQEYKEQYDELNKDD